MSRCSFQRRGVKTRGEPRDFNDDIAVVAPFCLLHIPAERTGSSRFQALRVSSWAISFDRIPPLYFLEKGRILDNR